MWEFAPYVGLKRKDSGGMAQELGGFQRRLVSYTNGGLIIGVARGDQDFAVILTVGAHIDVPGQWDGASVVIVVLCTAHLGIHIWAL